MSLWKKDADKSKESVNSIQIETREEKSLFSSKLVWTKFKSSNYYHCIYDTDETLVN